MEGKLYLMYHNDHSPPHFHAIYGSHKGVFSINDFKQFKVSLNTVIWPNEADVSPDFLYEVGEDA